MAESFLFPQFFTLFFIDFWTFIFHILYMPTRPLNRQGNSTAGALNPGRTQVTHGVPSPGNPLAREPI